MQGPRIQQSVVAERNSARTADAGVNIRHLFIRRLGGDFVLADDMELPLLSAVVPDGMDLLDVLQLEPRCGVGLGESSDYVR